MEFLESDIPLARFTPGQADDFRVFLLGKGQAEATVRRRCKRAKQFFAAAIKHGHITSNPCDGVPTANVANGGRRVFVERDTISAVIAACPDDQWRLIFALARYGGLRMPSEIQGLRWTDIDWSGRRFRVHSPKTEHIEGKKHRDVPLFPELAPYFGAWQQQRGEGEALVFPALIERSNLRAHALRIIRKAGIEPWTRVFQNLRASRETELVEEVPVHVVASWLGNSPETAAKHYLTVLEAHFERAVCSDSRVRGTDMGHTTAVRGCQTLTPENGESSEVLEVERVDNESQREAIPGKTVLAPPRGIEPLFPG
jgi:integrase